MDETRWRVCGDAQQLLAFLSGRASGRKLRLFAVACSRRIWDRIDAPGRTAVETAERFADGLVSPQELRAARLACKDAGSQASWYAAATDPARAAGNAARSALAGMGHQSSGDSGPAERLVQCGLLRCIFANPFCPVDCGRAWQTPAIVALAQAAYQERQLPAGTLAPSRLAVLADALQESGCDNRELLAHLRGPGPHVRGCFAVDLCLGLE